MAGSIAEFKASFNKEIARPSKFDVEIPIPIALITYLGTSRNLNMRCEAAQLPGRTIATTSMKIYGPEEKFPYQTTYNDVELTFIVDDDMSQKIFFDAWLEWINPSLTYDMKYKGDYAVPVRINQYDVQNKISYSIDLIDAFPIAINEMDLDWSSDTYHKMTVTFSYSKWKNNSVEALGMELLSAGIGNVVDKLGGLGGNFTSTAMGIGLQGLTGNGVGYTGEK
jgi:hypothetical protein